MKKTFVLTIVLLLARGSLFAQTVATSAGGDDQNITGSVSYTIGQTIYTTASNLDEEIIQGIQIPYDVSILVNNQDNLSERGNIDIYPNPTEDFIKIVTNEAFSLDNYYYELYNSNGVTVNSSAFSTNQLMSMQHVNPGIYLLVVKKNNELIKTFKIIKK